MKNKIQFRNNMGKDQLWGRMAGIALVMSLDKLSLVLYKECCASETKTTLEMYTNMVHIPTWYT